MLLFELTSIAREGDRVVKVDKSFSVLFSISRLEFDELVSVLWFSR